MGKFYAVKNGRKPGIYNTWEECKEQVDGFSNACYKSFKTLNEAQDYIMSDAAKVSEKKASVKKNDKKASENDKDITMDELHPEANKSHLIAYVDGSYNDAKKRVGMGIIIYDGENVIEISKEVFAGDLISMRNVAGEIKAAEGAMRYAKDKGAKTIDIYHDYKGVACWCTGEWKANLEGTKEYRDYYRSLESLKVNFFKVKAHTGDVYNEKVDALAKKACGLE